MVGMSKRYPLSRASKAFEAIRKAEPEFAAKAVREGAIDLDSGLLAAYAAKCLRQMYARTGETDQRLCMAQLNMLAARDGSIVTVDDLVWASRWQSCRQVFRINETVAVELPKTELDDEIPCEVFKRLPYQIIYVDRSFKAPISSGETIDIAGFIAYTIRWNDGSTRIGIVMIRPEGGRIYTSIPTGEKTTIKSLVDADVGLEHGNGNPLSMAAQLQDSKTGYDEAVDAMSTIVSSLLYIISAEDDARTVYAPPKATRGSKPGKKTNLETVTEVGARIGRAIGETRRSISYRIPTANSTGRTVAPHIRAAHWQHYWIGQRKGRTDGRYGEELIVKWVPPVPVNEDFGEVTETIHN